LPKFRLNFAQIKQSLAKSDQFYPKNFY